MKRFFSAFFWIFLFFSLTPVWAGKDQPKIDIPYTKYTLKNGLRLIVHEDHKAPIVAVNVWYHVGSKNEKLGKTGFAHLFEHLMFNGSENFNDDYFVALEKVGATGLNGTTNQDRTNYFQNIPTPALDFVLWMESDRMGHLLGAINQAKLDEQRGVVQNEKRQNENRPYGMAWELIPKATYPKGHPYSWSVIGSMEDLNAASLKDVREWFKTYYGAANAIITIAGDIDPKTAREKVEKYFGDIPQGPPISRPRVWIAKRRGTHREVLQDRVPLARLYMVWNVPEFASIETTYLDLISDLFAVGKSSRLWRRLVYKDRIASDVGVFISPREIGSQFFVQATARSGHTLKELEKAIQEELQQFFAKGPTREELKRAKAQYKARFIRGIERIGGFGGKSDILAAGEVYAGDPKFFIKSLKDIEKVKQSQLTRTAKRWLSDGAYVLEVQPFPKHSTTKSSVDRSKLPIPKFKPKVSFPPFQRDTLTNELKLILVERHNIPLVQIKLLLDAGYAADSFHPAGTAKMTLSMLDEGAKGKSALEISNELVELGATISVSSTLDMSTVKLSALKENLEPSLKLYADVLLHPSFQQKEFDRLKKKFLDNIEQEKASPHQMALRLLPKYVYGKNHAYGNPFTGSGTKKSVSKITIKEIRKFHQAWFKPNAATLVIVGDTSLKKIKPLLEKYFRTWKPGDVPQKNIGRVKPRKKSVIYIMDRPGSIQSVILAGKLAPPQVNPDEIAIETMNTILGGIFSSRLNMNLREDKHWSYGARTFVPGARGQRMFGAMAAVQTDKTAPSLREMIKEFKDITSSRPITTKELAKTKKFQTLRLPGRWETNSSVANSIHSIVQYGWPDDYYVKYPGKVNQLTVQDVFRAAKKVVNINQLVWIVVGDRKKIESGIRKLRIAPVRFIDAEGTPIP